MKLLDAVKNIQYDSSWGIWAEFPFTPNSEARYGQVQFENGDLLDEKQFFADGVECGNWFTDWFEGIDEPTDFQIDEGAREYIEVVYTDREYWK